MSNVVTFQDKIPDTGAGEDNMLMFSADVNELKNTQNNGINQEDLEASADGQLVYNTSFPLRDNFAVFLNGAPLRKTQFTRTNDTTVTLVGVSTRQGDQITILS